MAQIDIVPELMAAITTEFAARLSEVRELPLLLEKINAGHGTHDDGHELAQLRGEVLSETFKHIITPEALPNGRFYYNIATRTVRPMLYANYEAVNDAGQIIQAGIDRADGIGLKALRAGFAEGRVAGLIDKLTAEEVPTEDALRFLGEPVVNCTEAFYDDFIITNAGARYRAGMDVKIVRTLGAAERRSYRVGRRTRTYQVPCPYCLSLAGTYTYEDARASEPSVFSRHESCRCVISMISERDSSSALTRARWS